MGNIRHTGGRAPADGPTLIRRPTGRRGPGVVVQPKPSARFSEEWRLARPMPKPPSGQITLSNSILDHIVPANYGIRTLTGYIGARYESSNVLTLGIVFCGGEQSGLAVADCYLNGEAITAVPGVANETVHPGDGSTAISAYLTSIPGWTAARTTRWKSRTHLVCRITRRESLSDGNLQFTAKVDGKIVDASWRTGGSASVATRNFGEVGHNMCTAADQRNIAAARVDATSFEALAEWCAETMSDGARYRCDGSFDIRDPNEALRMALGHALAYPYIGQDGKIAVYADMPPPPITGDWSTSGNTWTEDATAGAAIADLTVGYWFVGEDNVVYTVTVITDDDNFDTDVTPGTPFSGVKVRPGSQIHIKEESQQGWVRLPDPYESSLLKAADEMTVRYSDGTTNGSHQLTVQYDGGGDKTRDLYLPMVTSAAVATRIGETMLGVENLQRRYWVNGSVHNNIGIKLQPGDLVLFDDSGLGLTAKPARVLAPITATPDGAYKITLREFDMTAYSDSTATTPTVPAAASTYSASNRSVFPGIDTVVSGTQRSMIGEASGKVVAGDNSVGTDIEGTSIEAPYNVGYSIQDSGGTAYQGIEFDGSNRWVVGDGAKDVFLDSAGPIILPEDGSFKHDFVVKDTFLNWNKTAGTYGLGNTSYDLAIEGDALTIEGNTSITFKGYRYHATVWPTTSNLDSGEWCIWVRGTSGCRLYVRVGGVMWYVSLGAS